MMPKSVSTMTSFAALIIPCRFVKSVSFNKAPWVAGAEPKLPDAQGASSAVAEAPGIAQTPGSPAFNPPGTVGAPTKLCLGGIARCFPLHPARKWVPHPKTRCAAESFRVGTTTASQTCHPSVATATESLP